MKNRASHYKNSQLEIKKVSKKSQARPPTLFQVPPFSNFVCISLEHIQKSKVMEIEFK
jgi:hypothetical protein